MSENRHRRNSYDGIAGLYDSARPPYPEALFDDIAAYARLDESARLLEVGCGTGQATVSMARRGFTIDAVELGAQLGSIARQKLSAFPKANIICADFETISLPREIYDLLFSATAFHWIDPAIRFHKARELLKPSGALALFWHRPTLTDLSRPYLEPLQSVYERVAPELVRDFSPPPHPEDLRTEYHELITASGLFGHLTISKHYVTTEYSAAAYVNLLGTFSDHRSLDAGKRERLLAGIETLINREFNGVIIRETVALLYLAQGL
ncbi:MAG: class I SAM-dependent methyltransferase [Chloroflexi bacterium]|nr:class I SAM-dependent methyltransferase [Chloroflexota bacterium]